MEEKGCQNEIIFIKNVYILNKNKASSFKVIVGEWLIICDQIEKKLRKIIAKKTLDGWV